MSALERPLPVRILIFGGWVSLVLAGTAFVIGGVNQFDELAKIWAVVGAGFLISAIAAFWGSRPSPDGFLAALVACSLLLFVFPLVIVISIVSSQTWPQVRDYYGLRRRSVA